MGLVWAALEFRMILNTHVERSFGQFDGFNQTTVGRDATERQTSIGKQVAVVVVKFVAVAMALRNLRGTVTACHGRIG